MPNQNFIFLQWPPPFDRCQNYFISNLTFITCNKKLSVFSEFVISYIVEIELKISGQLIYISDRKARRLGNQSKYQILICVKDVQEMSKSVLITNNKSVHLPTFFLANSSLINHQYWKKTQIIWRKTCLCSHKIVTYNCI